MMVKKTFVELQCLHLSLTLIQSISTLQNSHYQIKTRDKLLKTSQAIMAEIFLHITQSVFKTLQKFASLE